MELVLWKVCDPGQDGIVIAGGHLASGPSRMKMGKGKVSGLQIEKHFNV